MSRSYNFFLELIQAEIHDVEQQFFLPINVMIEAGFGHAERVRDVINGRSIIAFAKDYLSRSSINFSESLLIWSRFFLWFYVSHLFLDSRLGSPKRVTLQPSYRPSGRLYILSVLSSTASPPDVRRGLCPAVGVPLFFGLRPSAGHHRSINDEK